MDVFRFADHSIPVNVKLQVFFLALRYMSQHAVRPSSEQNRPVLSHSGRFVNYLLVVAFYMLLFFTISWLSQHFRVPGNSGRLPAQSGNSK